jgi:hypothetical protein
MDDGRIFQGTYCVTVLGGRFLCIPFHDRLLYLEGVRPKEIQ